MDRITTADQTSLCFKHWSEGHLLNSCDRGGLGRSSQPWNIFNCNTLALDLWRVMEQPKLDNATQMGFAMGSHMQRQAKDLLALLKA